jgi:hypothetical protein
VVPDGEELRQMRDLYDAIIARCDEKRDISTEDYALYCSKIFAIAANHRMSKKEENIRDAYDRVQKYMDEWNSYPQRVLVDGMRNDYVRFGTARFGFSDKGNSSKIADYDWGLFSGADRRSDGRFYYSDNKIHAHNSPKWKNFGTTSSGVAWDTVAVTDPYDACYWKKVEAVEDLPCSADNLLPYADVQDCWYFDPRLQSKIPGFGPFLMADWDGNLENLKSSDGTNPSECEYFSGFGPETLLVNDNDERQFSYYYPNDAKSDPGAKQASYLDSQRKCPDYSVRIFFHDDSPPNSWRELESSMAKNLQSKWRSGTYEGVHLLPEACFSDDGFSDVFHQICGRIAQGTDQDDSLGKITFELKWGTGDHDVGSTFVVSKISVGATEYVNSSAQHLSGVECGGIPASAFQMPQVGQGQDSTAVDFWNIPTAVSGGVPTAQEYLLDLNPCAVAGQLRLASGHVDCWSDALRIYSDQLSAENTRKTNDVQRFLTMSQQIISFATSFQKGIKQGADTVTAGIQGR